METQLNAEIKEEEEAFRKLFSFRFTNKFMFGTFSLHNLLRFNNWKFYLSRVIVNRHQRIYQWTLCLQIERMTTDVDSTKKQFLCEREIVEKYFFSEKIFFLTWSFCASTHTCFCSEWNLLGTWGWEWKSELNSEKKYKFFRLFQEKGKS